MQTIIQKSAVILLLLLLSQRIWAQVPVISYPGAQVYTVGMPASLSVTNTGGTPMVNGQTSAFIGSGAAGNMNGTGQGASFTELKGVVADTLGNLYVSDAANNVIRKVTPGGIVITFAGSGNVGSSNGSGTGASFNHPEGLCIDGAGNIYVADEYNNQIRKVSPAGVVSTLAGSGSSGAVNGAATMSSFFNPCGVAANGAGNIYVADYGNNQIRMISPSGVVSTFAGSGASGAADGAATLATFKSPVGITADASGNLYVADRGNNEIRKISPSGLVSTLAGNTAAGAANGPGTSAGFNFPCGVAVDAAGNVYVADGHNNEIRMISPAGLVSTMAGITTSGAANGPGTTASFNTPFALCIDKLGTLYVGDYLNYQVRKVATTNFGISLYLPSGLSFNPATGAIGGTPTAASPATNYLVYAYNSFGAGTTGLNMVVVPQTGLNLSSSQNYVVSYTPRVSGMTGNSNVYTSVNNPAQVETTVQYIDGLGRPIQTVSVKGSPQLNDMVEPIAYDAYGRETTKYLPYTLTSSAVSDGSYKSNALTAGAGQNLFYTSPPSGVSAVSNPQSVTGFEPSPLNRVLEQGSPGDAWQLSTNGVIGSGHTVKITYSTNNNSTALADTTDSTTVALYTVIINSDQSRTLVRSSGIAGYYAGGQLYLTISRNENLPTTGRGGTVEEYKDKEGHVVLKRTYNYVSGSLQILSTYYVYDDLGDLAFVLTPASGADSATPIQTTLDNLCYQYRYDERNRLNQKKLPGKGWEYTVYNQLDQAVLSQDANQRSTNQWSVVKYDGQGRTVMTGLWNAGSVIPLSTLQASVYAAAQWDNRDLTNNPTAYPTGYVIGSYPTINTLLSINYYDNYSIPNLPAKYVVSSGASTNTAGLLTATQTNILGTTNMLWSVHYYDDLGRALESYQQHDQGGGTPNANNYDVDSTSYNFTNAVTGIIRKHFNAAYSTTVPVVKIANGYTYDHIGRKLQTTEAIASGSSGLPAATVLAQNDYNEMGQLLTKHLDSETGGAPFLQDVGYTYNERGWVRTVGTGTLFSEDIRYNTPDANISKQYNGNISEALYSKTGVGTITDSYSYDELNRLTNAASGDSLAEAVSYDPMGNIATLTRQGPSAATLSYTYLNGGLSNQLQTVMNSSTTFRSYAAYDQNGNAPSDGTPTTPKNITYNLLNLPQTVSQGGTTLATYTYDAAGNKIANKGKDGYWDYVGGIVYNGTTATNGVIAFIQTEEGRAVSQGGTWHYEYNLMDHLGNVRLSFDKDPTAGTARRLQEDEYYAFGLRNAFYDYSNNNRYLYNGKEVQTDLTSQYDYGARFYDPVIGRFTSIDPLAEKGRRWSPYNYGMDDPIRMVDPDGMWPFPVNIRSFAPFKEFGGWFAGDNRGYSTSSTATSRVAQSFTVDPAKGTHTAPVTSSSPSEHPLLGTATAKDDRGSITNFTSTANKDGSNTVSFTSTLAGHNPLVPGSPDIDVHTKFSLTENDKAGTLKVNAVQTGDAFPSAETMIGDTKGNQLFIGVSAANGNPYTSLPGDNDRPMMQANFTITMDSKGVFTGVQQGDKTYSTADWNKMNQNKPTVQK